MTTCMTDRSRGVFTVAQLRAVEQAAAATLPPGALMERAGAAAASAALSLLQGRSGPVLVLAGPGNNGGDALEVAAGLCAAGIDVAVLHLAGGSASFETQRALARARAGGARFLERLDQLPSWTLAIDGLFGIGLTRALDGPALAWTLAVNDAAAAGIPVLALDVPSGLDADTGAMVGMDSVGGTAGTHTTRGAAIEATHTITFIADKPGLHTNAGRDHAGVVQVAALGIDPALLPQPDAVLNSPELFDRHLQPRRHASHKGSFGDVAIVGGARGMAGAAVLAARSALYAGAGRVFAVMLDAGPAYDSLQPEIMFRDAADFDAARSTQVMGPGMGQSAQASSLLGKAIDGAAPLVLDADALNLLAATPQLQRRLAHRATHALLTPHPLEAARLLGVTAAVIQSDRLAAARELAVRLNAVVVLKGSGTVIASAASAAVINPTGNPGLATGGTGDVLAGLCGALLAQGMPPWEAALAAVWLHGSAADRLVDQATGPIGLTASELPPAIRALINLIACGKKATVFVK